MKTAQEIEAEAQRLMVLGRRYRDEQREASASAVAVPLPRVLERLPGSFRTTQPEAQPVSESLITPRRERSIEAAMERGLVVYRLVEQEAVMAGSGQIGRDSVPSIVMSSRSALDVLQAGYEVVEEERLASLLARYAGGREVGDDSGPVDGEAVAELEAILETDLLPHADRLRTKAEIVEFLEGRLEASAFITCAISRHWARNCRRETQAERHEMKLTIDEP